MSESKGMIDARVRVVFLLAAATGIFFLRDIALLGVAIGGLLVLWLVVGLPARRLARQIFKLWGFALFIAVSYGFFENEAGADRWVEVVPQLPKINVAGLLVGVVMFLRVLAVILASQIARAGDARAISAGLGKLGVPRSVAISIDAVLSLLGDDERHGTGGGRGRGGGQGQGTGRRQAEAAEAAAERETGGLIAGLKRVMSGDVAPIVQKLDMQIDRAERHIHRGTNLDRGVRREIATIAGVSLTMLGVKALKILPSIPFAPGHKLVILTPLYIVARLKTRGRFGASLTGLTMGTVAFLLGDGKYGIFEILKHIAPGVACDVCMPLLLARGRRPGALAWSVFGGVIAIARFASIFAVTLTVQAPSVAYAMLLPGLAVHMSFGIVSGYVTHHLVRVVRPETSKNDDEGNVQATTAETEDPVVEELR